MAAAAAGDRIVAMRSELKPPGSTSRLVRG